MGAPPIHSSLDDIPGPSSYSVVAPFAGNIDTSSGGSVKYTQYTSFDYQMMNTVSRFIRSQTISTFYGTRMIVAEWSSVPQYGKPNVSSANLYKRRFAIIVKRINKFISPSIELKEECSYYHKDNPSVLVLGIYLVLLPGSYTL